MDNDMQTKTALRHPAAKLYKPRRQFRAWLLDELRKAGAILPDDPAYKVIAPEIERVWIKPLQRQREDQR